MWEQRRARCWEYWRHFNGNWLDETISETAEDINERLADVGDIVSENARLLPAITNTRRVGITRLATGPRSSTWTRQRRGWTSQILTLA